MSLQENLIPDDARLKIIVESYQQLTGKRLLDTNFTPRSIWYAQRAIVAHGTEDDPIFFYGNQVALQHFEMNFEQFTRLPSRLSVEPDVQQARAMLMYKVSTQGYIENYSGERISSSGSRFTIQDVTIWNLLDSKGVYHGQAAAFTVAHQAETPVDPR
jgi:hypothetical protein